MSCMENLTPKSCYKIYDVECIPRDSYADNDYGKAIHDILITYFYEPWFKVGVDDNVISTEKKITEFIS